MAAEVELLEAEDKMEKALEVLKGEFATIRTGRASPTLVERIEVEYYGTKTPLNQLAGISVPEARLMVISPFDPNSAGPIEKALLASDLGITPNNDGTVIRLAFPQPTEERRKEMIKVVHQKSEDTRVSVRNIRRHAKDEIEAAQKKGEMGEDDLHRAEKDLQALTDRFTERVDELMQHKETELLEV